MAGVCLYVGLLSSMLSLAFIVFGMASSQWVRIRSHYFVNDVGIMRHCDVVSKYCGDMERINDLIDAQYTALFRSLQAFYLLHCLGMLFSGVIYGLYALRFFEAKGGFRVLTVFNVLALAAGVFTLAMYGTKYRQIFGLTSPEYDTNIIIDKNSHISHHVAEFGYGFIMAAIGCVLAAIVTACSLLEASRAVDLLRNMQNRLTVWTSPYTLFVDQEA
ncbi:hypothetical protein PoB_006165200 [Plakobranchus ocellatus]|uniref:Uncharacterized protein n=1 Tax=Plakobranchus ocellatus TaxID=259542 RepID=A0AAV4CTA8_9GAST|nr:hypothetical protein PoB_006165200 [Plakobranchus ocellatus]